MGLFDKLTKHEKDIKETESIKNVASQKTTENSNQPQQNEPQNFVNPFANEVSQNNDLQNSNSNNLQGQNNPETNLQSNNNMYYNQQNNQNLSPENSLNNQNNPFDNNQENNLGINPNSNNVQNNDINSQINSNNLNQMENINSNPNVDFSNNSNQANMVENTFENNYQSMNPEQDLASAGLIQEDKSVDYDKIQEMIDETVEKIIEEKWEKLLMSVDKVLTWKEKEEKQINELSDAIESFKERFVTLEKKMLDKISSYDQDILDIGSEIKALEKVFQKITPTLVNNVNELSNITTEIKEALGDSKNKKK